MLSVLKPSYLLRLHLLSMFVMLCLLMRGGVVEPSVPIRPSGEGVYYNQWLWLESSSLALSPPSNIAVTGVTTTTVAFSWTNNGDSRTGTRVYRKQLAASGLSTSGTYSLITTTAANDTTYTATGLSEAEAYVWKHCATDGASEQCAAQISGTTDFSGTRNNYNTTRNVIAEPTLKALPLKGGYVWDTTFGVKFMRVTDDTDWGANTDGAGTFYNQWPTFNADNTRVLIRAGTSGDAIIKVFDPVTFTLGATVRQTELGVMSCSISRGCSDSYSMDWQAATWDYSDPDKIWITGAFSYTAGGLRQWSYKPSTDQFTLVKDFSGTSPFSAAYSVETHSNVIGNDLFTYMVVVQGASGNPSRLLAWRRSTNTIILNINNDPGTGGYNVNNINPSKGGDWIYMGPNSGNNTRRVLTVATGIETTFDDTHEPASHGDLGTTFLFGRSTNEQKRLYTALTTPDNNYLDWEDNGGVRDWSEDCHTSLYANDETWALLGCYDLADTLETGVWENEIMQVSTVNATSWRRLFHHRALILNTTLENGYWAIPKPTISLNGRFIAFTSNWEDSGRMDMFVAEVTQTLLGPATFRGPIQVRGRVTVQP